MSNVHFSSATDQWATPDDFFNKVSQAFKFDVDVCADKDNAKCAKFYTEEDNGLHQEWRGVCWMNPPYGRAIKLWIEKAYRSSQENGATVVCLIPARTDTQYWHDYCTKGEVFFLKGRLKFGNATAGAPFPSAIVVFRPKLSDFLDGYTN